MKKCARKWLLLWRYAFQHLREINLPRLDASKIQKIRDEDKENVLVECRYGQLSSTDGQSGQKKTKQNKIIGRAKCCAAVNRKFCCNVYNFALVYQVIFCLGLIIYTFATSKHFLAFTRFYASVSGSFRALAVDLSNLWQVSLDYI